MLNADKPSLELYRQVQAGAILLGKSFMELATELGFQNTNAKMALTGAWNGKKGKEVREKLIEAVKPAYEKIKKGE